MKPLWHLLVVSLALAGIGAVRVESPKGKEHRQSLGARMTAAPLPLTPLIVPSTNKIFHLTVSWDYPYDLSGITNFQFYMGLSPGTYSISEPAGMNWNGTNFTYTFLRTNWGEERLERHWIVVTAGDTNGLESPPSNEVHWPLFPPDHWMLTWQSNWDAVNVFSTTNLALPKNEWPLIALVMGSNSLTGKTDQAQQFFTIDKPDILNLTVFNPNP